MCGYESCHAMVFITGSRTITSSKPLSLSCKGQWPSRSRTTSGTQPPRPKQTTVKRSETLPNEKQRTTAPTEAGKDRKPPPPLQSHLNIHPTTCPNTPILALQPSTPKPALQTNHSVRKLGQVHLPALRHACGTELTPATRPGVKERATKDIL